MTVEKTVRYIIRDNHGAPQCGCDVIECEYWDEVEEYFCYDDDALERLDHGYASIEHVDGWEPCKAYRVVA